MFTFSIGNAQQKTVSGTVLDDLGGPLPGATILVDGTTRGSTSDFDGNYSIEASLENNITHATNTVYLLILKNHP